MPKIRAAGASLADALKHLRVFQARIGNTPQHQEYARKITDAIVNIQSVQKSFPIDENDIELFSDEQINSGMSLIQKEYKKDKPKINRLEILRTICAATNSNEVLRLQREYGLTKQQLQLIAAKAPNTHVGKVFAQIHKSKPVTVPIEAPAVKAPLVFDEDVQQDEEQVTIDSDDEVMAQLR